MKPDELKFTEMVRKRERYEILTSPEVAGPLLLRSPLESWVREKWSPNPISKIKLALDSPVVGIENTGVEHPSHHRRIDDAILTPKQLI